MMEETHACHITWDEERAEIASTLVKELGISQSKAASIASLIQDNLNQIILSRFT